MLYTREHLGELIHLDTKKLPRLEGETAKDGKEYIFVAIDDCSRWAYATVMPDKTDDSAAAFIDEVLTVSPVPIQAVMTDKGKEYRGKLERGHAAGHRYSFLHKLVCIYPSRFWTRLLRIITHSSSTLPKDFISWYNTRKGHSSLKGETPYEYIINHYKLCQECTQRLGR
jgi:transposase InsO family protein